MAKIVISCAITGAVHTPSMSDGLPCTPKDIAEQAVAAYEAGAEDSKTIPGFLAKKNLFTIITGNFCFGCEWLYLC